MGSPVRNVLVAALACVSVVGMNGLTGAVGSSGATTTRGRTLFGVNVPSLAALDHAE